MRASLKRLATVLAILSAFAGPVASQSVCPGNGALTLATTGGRLGDPFSLTLSGTPNVSGLLGFDLAGGPVITALGNVCFGLSPALQLQSFTLDPAGGFGIAGLVPPSPPLRGSRCSCRPPRTTPRSRPGSRSATRRAPICGRRTCTPSRTPRSRWRRTPAHGKVGPVRRAVDAFVPRRDLPRDHRAPGGGARPSAGSPLLLGNGTVAIHDATATRQRPDGHAAARVPRPGPASRVVGTTLLVHDPGSLTASAVLRALSLPVGALGSGPCPCRPPRG